MSNQGSGRLAWFLLLGSVLGFAIGCKGSKHPEGWFDACCAQCNEGHCTECHETKGECGDKHEAECLNHEAGLMCRKHVDE